MDYEQKAEVKPRISSIDAMRGLVIVLMALDHCRDFFGDVRIATEDPATTTLAFFLTRWVTHLCAVSFVFLAGVSAWHHGEKLGSRRELAGFLFRRGLWLLFLEFTVVYFALALSFTILPWMFLVIAAIGTSMIALAGLCFLPTRAVLVIGLLIVCGHNLLDGIEASQFGSLDWLWLLIHDGPAYIPWANLEIGYPFLAWIGVMATGFGLAPLMLRPPVERSHFLIGLGGLLVLSFIGLRLLNSYGDEQPWSLQEFPTSQTMQTVIGEAAHPATAESPAAENRIDWLRTGFSFLRATKYPPSLVFILMTLGPALMLLGCFERLGKSSFVVSTFEVFGRVPLFFYVVHFYLIHLGSVVFYRLARGVYLSPFQAIYSYSDDNPLPEEFGFDGLLQVYLAWLIVLVIMFPLCRGFGVLKRRGKSKIWSYL